MTIQVNIAEAKAKLSELVARAEAGEEVVIARHGRPIVALTPKAPPQNGRRRIGVWEHLNLSIPLSAFDPDPDLEAWLDKSVFPDE
ncbi:MAG TPA: type II toxin-antitoxin system prevent-host-death family antitoxin [Caulobacteraceae bacterium]|jgi:prevent-host-death family protein|nr:type II toxin-antitoxin system prevent-host-death family antitoxin [Caulobacteraceae bacterium]